MKVKIKKFGDGVGIYFTKEDCELYGIKIDDVLDIKILAINDKPMKLDWKIMNKRVRDNDKY